MCSDISGTFRTHRLTASLFAGLMFHCVSSEWRTDTDAHFLFFCPPCALMSSLHPSLLLINHFILPLHLLSSSSSSHSSTLLHSQLVSPCVLHLFSSFHPSLPPPLHLPPPPSLRWEVSELHWSRPSVGERWVMTVIRHRRRSPPLLAAPRRSPPVRQAQGKSGQNTINYRYISLHTHTSFIRSLSVFIWVLTSLFFPLYLILFFCRGENVVCKDSETTKQRPSGFR